MDKKELKQIFKKYKNMYFLLKDKNIHFGWGVDSETWIPHEKIFIGRHGVHRPDVTLTPYEIERVEYTKPGLFKAGILTIVGTNGQKIAFEFKDKVNMKTADMFNECLALYKQYNLGE